MRKLAWILLLPAWAAAAPGQEAAKQFVGAWRLVSIEGSSRLNPRVYDRPSGILMYDASGWMSVQISYLANRPPFANRAGAGTQGEKAAAYESYTAYYGTYKVNAKEGTITHHLQDRLQPGGRGVDNVRYFERKGNRLVLMPVEDGKGGVIPRREATYKLTWERIR